MRAIITGGTGFIGRSLCAELLEGGHEVVVLSRSPEKVARVFGRGVIGLRWNGADASGWAHMINADTALVNLAGENIAGRWTRAKMRSIRESRLEAGKSVMHALELAQEKPAVLVQASAVGYYGGSRDLESDAAGVDESSPAGSGFLAEVARAWEDSTRGAEDMGVRRVVIRTGMVLGPGGALGMMLTPFRLGLGGRIGSGRQPMSWIQLQDEVRAIRFLMECGQCSGPYNLVSPQVVSNAAFTRALGRALHRPAVLPVPAFALRLLWGSMADEVLLSGQNAPPDRLQDEGFVFRHAELGPALDFTLKQLRSA